MRTMQFRRFEALDYAGTEALNTLCTNLSFAGSNVKKIMFTSCHESEGKSFLTMQTMRAMGKMGKKVVFVDADLRRSILISRYGIHTDGKMLGLAHYLAGFCEMENIVYQTNLPGASFVPMGREIANPLPLLNSSLLPRFLDRLAEAFDLVIIDAPPVGLVIDAAQIAKHCDGALFVVEFNNTRRHELMEAKMQIAQSGCPLLGCVINKVSFDSYSAKRYYNKAYSSYYTRGEYPNDDMQPAKRNAPDKRKK